MCRIIAKQLFSSYASDVLKILNQSCQKHACFTKVKSKFWLLLFCNEKWSMLENEEIRERHLIIKKNCFSECVELSGQEE